MTNRTKECRECGKSFLPRQHSSLFCSSGCRSRFNNRRDARGAELYDLLMADWPKIHPRVPDLMAAYKRADAKFRQGRGSHQPTVYALSRIPNVYGEDGDGR